MNPKSLEDERSNNPNVGSGDNSGSRSPRITVSMDNFKIVRNQNNVNQDILYLQERLKDFKEKGYLAKALERIAANGFEDYRWLGNIPNKNGQTPFDVVPVYSACLAEDESIAYDDVVNRVDYAAMIQSEKDEVSITLGFDITTDSDIDSDKIIRSSNDGRKELPFGFSGLDYPYYPDGHMLSEITCIPRYCIAMDIDDTYIKDYDNARKQSHLQPTDEKTVKRIEDSKKSLKRKNDKACFLVLSEIYEQNELYLSMLPAKNGRNNRIVDTAEGQLKRIKTKIWPALLRASYECPIELSVIGMIDSSQRTEDDQKIIEVKDRRSEINERIKQLAQERGQKGKRTQEEIGLQLERYELVKGYAMSKNKCYATLIAKTNELKSQSETGKIDYLKQIQPRNKKS